MRALELGRQLARLLVFTRGPFAHACTRRSHFLADTFLSFGHIQFHLVIVFQMTPSCLDEIGVIVGHGASFCRGLWPFLSAVAWIKCHSGLHPLALSAVVRIKRR